jgi:hypothetical protein
MSRTGLLALLVVGLSTACVGALLALAFAIPALGLNRYGRNPTEVTLLAESVATVLYLSGAGAEVKGARLLAQRPHRPARRILLGAASYFAMSSALAVSLPPLHGDWEGGLLVLLVEAAMVAPIALGWLSIRRVSAPPRRLQH